jgi:hypothetical protein
MESWSSVGDEVGSKDDDGVNDGILDGNIVGLWEFVGVCGSLWEFVGCADGIPDGKVVGV